MNPHEPASRHSREAPSLSDGLTLALALTLFAGVFVLRSKDPSVADSDLVLFVVPIALLALRFGLRGGLAGGLVGLALVVGWDLSDDIPLTLVGYLSRVTAFLLLGALLGVFVDRQRRSQAQISAYHDASVDLLATADLSGRLTRVNPAWERLLGHPAETLCSRPFIEFVHPDDREATLAETAALVEGSRGTASFRNRCRAADGTYRWLEWSAKASPSEGAIYAAARDVSAQREAEQLLADHASLLEEQVAERTAELEGARVETLQRLALAAEYRDDDTYEHTERVGRSAVKIASQLGLDPDQTKVLREAAPLHDVGKLAIADSILLKPGRLSEQEYEIMQTHAELGARLLSGSNSPVLQMGEIIALSHHERWDGAGYPAGLAGETIPLAGRVVAVADVFDVLTHARPYKAAWPLEQAITEIQREAGSQLDPEVVKASLAMQKHAPTRLDEGAEPPRTASLANDIADEGCDPRSRSHAVATAARLAGTGPARVSLSWEEASLGWSRSGSGIDKPPAHGYQGPDRESAVDMGASPEEATRNDRRGERMARKYVDCREMPSESNCTVAIAADSEDEVVEAAVQHAVAVHSHEDSSELRDGIRQGIKDLEGAVV